MRKCWPPFITMSVVNLLDSSDPDAVAEAEAYFGTLKHLVQWKTVWQVSMPQQHLPMKDFKSMNGS